MTEPKKRIPSLEEYTNTANWVDDNTNEKYTFTTIPRIMKEIYALMSNIESYRVVRDNLSLKTDVQLLDERIQALSEYMIKNNIK